jgi:serpin B
MRKTKLVVISAAIMIAVAANSLATENAPPAKKTDKQIIVEGNNKFALELYAKLRGGEANLFLSPYSISTALAMTYAGARGETESQMAEVLHFPTIANPAAEPPATPETNRQQFASAFGKIVEDLNARGEKGGYELRVANALWGQKQYGFLEEFLELIKTNYGGQLNEVDFVGATEAARKTINTWVEKKTNDKIKNLIPKGVLDSMTRLVLTNAIYFKGNWARQFTQ